MERAENSETAKKTPYSGYYQRGVPGPDLECTGTDAGTPMGEFMRRFWQPVCLSEELADLPLPIRILGEDLVAFRDLSGRIGVVHRHCSHRGTSLEFGLLTERGIRCCYHGWLFDIDGTILETPGELEGSPIKDSVCHGAYPAFELHGLVFAYMGPPEDKPDFPVYDSIEVPGNKIHAMSNRFGCNWLQVQENIADPVHTTIFHNGVGNRALVEGAPPGTGTALPGAWGAELPVIEYQTTDNGAGMVYIVTRRLGDMVWVRHNHFILPNYIELANLFEEGTAQKYFSRVAFVRWVVPHDDESSSIFGWRYFNDEVDPKGLGDPSRLGVDDADFLDGQTGNRPAEERWRYPGDWEAIMGQRPIAVHGKENLGTSDYGVAMWRKLCRDAVRGRRPNVLPAPANGGGKPLSSYCQDTLYRLPALPGEEADREMMRQVGRRVTEIVIDDANLAAKSRVDIIRERLKEAEKAFQKTYY